ncbi:MAG: DUF3883 domain-containing protein [Candidatus Sedimenticola sp. PURPLELP]
MSLEYFAQQFSRLNINRTGGHGSPHKMCMLMAVIDLIGSGVITSNRIYFDARLKEHFSHHFNRYRREQDRDNPHLPFFHLRSEPFWYHQIKPGQRESYECLSTAGSSAAIDANIAYAYLDESLYELLKNQFVREYLTSTLESTLQEEERRSLLSPGNGWDWIECELTVQSYFSMLEKELRGERYNKAAFRRELQPKLSDRSEASIEFKHQNISAILVELGFPYISGYKPALNYQGQLKEVVEAYLISKYQDLVSESERFIESPTEEAETIDWSSILEEPPELSDLPTPSEVREFNPRQYNFAERETNNRRLGELGESFVLDFERSRMCAAGREDLVEEVEWTSKEKGDGAGYDIRSFRPEQDAELFIEVKTTNSGKYQPFYVSENELAFSNQHAPNYSLYRVYQYRSSPKLFTLYGKLGEHVHLFPRSYKASF